MISFGAMPSPNIPSLTVLLEKLSDKLGWIGENGSYSINIQNISKSEYGP